MKKFFFFRSSSNNGDDNAESPPSPERHAHREVPMDSQIPSICSGLRRSRSYSSADFLVDGLEERNNYALERLDSSNSDSSGSSCSNASTKVLDRYIDEEHQPERNQQKRNSLKNLRLPPRAVQYTAPTSPSVCASDRSGSRSFRETKNGLVRYSSGDWVETEFDRHSPRRLAKNVIEKLCRTCVPITIEDIHGGSVERCYDASVEDMKYYHNNDVEDLELARKSKEAEETVLHLSQQIEEESFLRSNGFDVPSLIKTVRKLANDKMSLAIEVSCLLKARIAEKDSAKENLRLVKEMFDSRAKRLEKEKNELQLALEKELDRRSNDWSMKLEKNRLEEQRLRERVRELAEQNVALQRETSCCNERETESRNMISLLRSRSEELSKENEKVKEELSELREKFEAAEEQLDSITRNFEKRNEECKDQQKSISRMLRTCSEQEKTIEGLRERLLEEDENQQSDKLDSQIIKLQSEQLRLSGLELTLRREIESYILEVDSLRHENVHLLERLKANGEEGGMLTFRLDKEMWSRVSCLQNQGLTLLNESVEVGSTLLQHVKENSGWHLDGQLVVESEMKVQGIRRKIENLTRSLHTAASLLQEKGDIVASRPVAPCIVGSPIMLKHMISAEALKSELKAETLLTSLFREKLYSKELEVEQLQAEVAAIERSNDVLRCEVQNARDNVSCLSHKLKDSDLQIQQQNENIHRLQSKLENSTKELAIAKGILSKVAAERDQMSEKVKQYNEENMLLNSEVNMLKKKMEELEEDVLLKEGQITILKDSINNRPFDFLASRNAKAFLLD